MPAGDNKDAGNQERNQGQEETGGSNPFYGINDFSPAFLLNQQNDQESCHQSSKQAKKQITVFREPSNHFIILVRKSQSFSMFAVLLFPQVQLLPTGQNFSTKPRIGVERLP